MLTRSRSVMGSKTKGRDPMRYATTALKRNVMERDGWTCQRCGVSLDMESANADHRVPWNQGGRTNLDNLQALCVHCNQQKSNSVAVPV